jgi:hypothetical protein
VAAQVPIHKRKKLKKASKAMDSKEVRNNRNNRGLAGQERSNEKEAPPWWAIQNNGTVLLGQWAKEEAQPPLRAKLLAQKLDGSAELRMGGEKINSSGAADNHFLGLSHPEENMADMARFRKLIPEENSCGGGLGVQVHKKDSLPLLGFPPSQVKAHGCFA